MPNNFFSKSSDRDFEIRCTLGAAQAGGSDVGEVLAAVAGIKPKDHEGWFDAWTELSIATATAAQDAAEAGHTVTAAWAHLRAAHYYSVAVNAASAVADSEELLQTFKKHLAAWEGFVDNAPVPVERVSIPYGRTRLPGYFFSPSGAKKARPTLIMSNGSDGAISAMWSQGGAAALARGYNFLAFDGPGQQSMLFEKGMPFRPDWEAVITPVVNFLVTRRDVSKSKLAIWGISQGGYWVPRAMAFEHRLAAGVADPGVVDVSASWMSNLPKSMIKLIDKGDAKKFNKDMKLGLKFQHDAERTWNFRARPYNSESYFDTIESVLQYKLDADTAAQIKSPLLITSPEDEQFWPGQSEALASMTPDVSEVVNFTEAEGADGHCQPLARTLTHERVLDWLDEKLAR
ncbi:MAG: prolyl oligopeptidase family serine peptidase [Thermoleophilaceae bacterium]|nr:prolyl oligopeptidase family serine peptidase [Thermoleophilaceae bacterium]